MIHSTEDEEGTEGEALGMHVTSIQEGISNSQASPGSSSLSLGYSSEHSLGLPANVSYGWGSQVVSAAPTPQQSPGFQHCLPLKT